MDQIYQVERSNISDLLDHIDNFKDKMDQFIEDHDSLEYDINIEKVTEDNKIKWIAKLLIIKDEE